MSQNDWRTRALCYQNPEDRDLFVPEEDGTQAIAIRKAVDVYCNYCPVRDECLDLGARTGSQGVWGGYYIPYRLAGELKDHPLDEIKAILEEES